MKQSLRHTFFTLALGLLLSGCAAYPAVQVAGGAMTGYDAAMLADEYLPRDSVKGGELCGNTDRMLERRLRERLKLNSLGAVSAHVIGRKAYLVGQLSDRNRAKYAVDTALTVQGLKTVTVKFYPKSDYREARNDTRLLRKLIRRLGETPRLKDIDLRVEVISANAILIGKAGNYDQKTAAVAIASEVGGVREVVDYITVTPAPEADGEKVARK